MKASSFIVLALAILPAISALAGCDNAGMQSQSQFASSQAREQNLGGHPKCTTCGQLKMYQGSVAT